MNPEFFEVPPPVGLIADATVPGARETLAQVAAELGRFGLAAESLPGLSPSAARAYARTAANLGRRALVVASADPSLAGGVAAETPLPVLRVPVGGTAGNALDLLWPGAGGKTPGGGVHATLAIGEAGARNAALFIVSVLALTDGGLRERWREFRQAQTRAVLAATLPAT